MNILLKRRVVKPGENCLVVVNERIIVRKWHIEKNKKLAYSFLEYKSTNDNG